MAGLAVLGSGEIEDGVRPVGVSEDGTEGVVHVAVKGEFEESEGTLIWALGNVARKKVFLVHVHRPHQFMNSVSQSTSKQVKAHNEQEKMHATLDKYASICECAEVQAEKLIIEANDVAKGLIRIIALHGVTKLVMGAAANKYYSKNMKVPKSKTARSVQKESPLSCNIWFVCGGNLICTREAPQNCNETHQSPMTSPSSTSTQSEPLPRPSSPPSDSQDSNEQGLQLWDGVSRSSQESHLSWLETDYATRQSGSTSILKDKEGEHDSSMYHSMHDFEEDDFSHAEFQQEVSVADDGVYDKLQEIITEVEKLKYENGRESRKRYTAEREAAEAKRKVKVLEMKIAREIKLKEQTDEALKIQQLNCKELRSLEVAISEELRATRNQKTALEAQLEASNFSVMDLEGKLLKAQELLSLLNQQRDELQEERAELRRERDDAVRGAQERERLESELRSKHAEISEELRVMHGEKTGSECQLATYYSIAVNVQERLLEAQQVISSLEKERNELQQGRDDAFREIEELRRMRVGENTSASMEFNFLEFSYSEIEQATQNLANSLKIGEGGYGSVYKGFLHHTMVAIKVMNPLGMQGSSEFHCEVEVLSRMRHPNLVTLMGACSERKALVYEYLPNGSLEDRLRCQNGSPPLSWKVRIRICAEICLALIFLHSNRPQCVVHGDLKPDNVLLDANFVSKLSDFGISRILSPAITSVVYHRTDPKGTFVYMDPELLATGLLTPQSDVYAFGILMLRLLTGKQPFGIVKLVKDALDERRLQEILDPTAGEWPFVQAQQLAHLGLRCSAMNRARRPDLVTEVLNVLEPMTRALSRPSSSSFRLTEDNNHIPSYFLCPIFQEIMEDPQVAADGFTYEAEAIKAWFEEEHDASPMTNVTLPNKQLIPNHALRSAIQEWVQQREQLRS